MIEMFDKITGLNSKKALNKEKLSQKKEFNAFANKIGDVSIYSDEYNFENTSIENSAHKAKKDGPLKVLDGVSAKFPYDKDHDDLKTFMYVGQAGGPLEKMMKIRAEMLGNQKGVKVNGRQLSEPCVKKFVQMS